MRTGKGCGNFFYLTTAFRRAKVDSGTDGDRAEVEGLLNGSEHGLVVQRRQGQGFVVVEFDQERDFVRVFARDAGEYAVGRGDRIASAFDGEFDDVLRIKVLRVDGKGSASRVFDPLIDRQDGDVAGTSEAAVVNDLLIGAQYGRRAVILREDAVDVIGAGQIEVFFGNRGAAVVEQGVGFLAKQLLQVLHDESPY